MVDHIRPVVDALSAQRKQLSLSQAVVAKRAGLTQTYLSKIEHAKVDPRLSTLQDVARAEGLEIVLVPTELVPAVRAMISGNPKPADNRLFQVDD